MTDFKEPDNGSSLNRWWVKVEKLWLEFKRFFGLSLLILLLTTPSYADINNPLNFRDEDGSPDTYPYQIKFTNGSLTDNGDGTISVSTGGSPGGSNAQVQFADGSSFGGDVSFSWNKSANLLGISRDASQTGSALVISSDSSIVPLASISHDGAFFGITMNTGQGDNELYAMNQAVRTTDSPTFADVTVNTEAYGAGWDGDNTVPTKDATYDKIETISGGSPGGSNSQIQFNDSSTFAGDTSLSWNKSGNFLAISRDASQTGYALVISSDNGTTTLGNISHDGSGFFESMQTRTFLQFRDLGYISDVSGKSVISIDAVTSAVNGLVVSNSVTGANPIISADGADTNVGINLNTKGTGAVVIAGIATATQSLITSGLVVNNAGTGNAADQFKVKDSAGGLVISTDNALPAIYTTGQFQSTNTGSIGWSVVDQTDNQACTVGCTYSCGFGIQNATGTAVTGLVGCSDNTADLCLCIGPN